MLIGLDLAWSPRARTGIAAVATTGELLDSAMVRTDDEIASWCQRPGWAATTVAIDAPIIVTNSHGQRACERMVSKEFGRFGASAHSANLGMAHLNPPRAGVLAARMGWQVDPAHFGTAAHPGCIEVYPHPAMVVLFGLPRVLPYKARRGRTLEVRRQAFAALTVHLAAIEPLALSRSSAWDRLRDAAAAATRQADLERIEDEVDSILCAHLAWLWRCAPERLQVFGDGQDGYIVVPRRVRAR